MVHRAICERLETIDHISEASECVVQMVNELGMETISNGEQKEWVTTFRQRCAEQLEYLGDEAANSQQHDAAVLRYSAALSLDLLVPQVFIKRSKVCLANGLWQDALHDANQAIALPSSPWDQAKVLTEWAKVNLTNGLWKGALDAARDVSILVMCRILCEGLESMDGIVDAVECFYRMSG
ncbi:hypothetical protein V8E55_001148, partial [Tylopilus felleus]